MENQPCARRELLNWLRTDFKCSIDRIEECGSGAMYLQILDRLYPNIVPMAKVNWQGHTEYDMLRNFKLLQDVLKQLNLTREFNIDNLVKRKLLDNLDLLQWFYALYQKRKNELPRDYDPVARRKLSQYALPSWAQKQKPLEPTSMSTLTGSSLFSRPNRSQPLPNALSAKKDKTSFYESKLKAIAMVCANTEDTEFVDKQIIEYIL